MRKTLTALFLLFTSCSAFAEMYKWVDAQGHIQFSDKKPDHTTKKVESFAAPTAQSTTNRSGSSASNEPPPAESSSLERTKKINQILQTERDQRSADASKLAEQKAAKKRQCAQLRDYKQHTAQGRIYDLDDNGQRKYLNDKEVATENASLDKRIAETCQ
jgi:hypothetical protein